MTTRSSSGKDVDTKVFTSHSATMLSERKTWEYDVFTTAALIKATLSCSNLPPTSLKQAIREVAQPNVNLRMESWAME